MKDALAKIKVYGSINQICSWLKKNGFVDCEKQIEWLNDNKPTIWAKGETEKWKALKPKELRDFYLQPINDREHYYFIGYDQVERVNAIANLDTLTKTM